MKVFKYFIGVVFSIGVLLLAFVWYSGIFKSVEVEVRDIGPFVAVYEDHYGDYKQTAEAQDMLYNKLWEDGIENYRAFGIFFKSNGQAYADSNQSRVGCIVEPAYEARIASMTSKYDIFRFSRQKCAVVEFPYRNYFSMHLAIAKSYPALTAYANTHKLKPGLIIEVYQIPDKIQFLLPLESVSGMPALENNP